MCVDVYEYMRMPVWVYVHVFICIVFALTFIFELLIFFLL